MDPDGPLDETDLAILAQLRAMHAELDPPPPTLTEQVIFALELVDVDADIARLQDEALIGSGARGASRSRTLTFEAHGISLLVSITELGDDRVRIDGWLVPAGECRVELRQAASVIRRATPDTAGRFVFDNVRQRLTRLRIHPGSGQAGRTIITPPIRL